MRKTQSSFLAALLVGSVAVLAANGLQAQAAHPLTKPDVDAWLDGLMPYALERDDIAGAVVVIVKDGGVLTQRGFGYADVAERKPVDPATTMFRPGSVSKLFTWTAVMQLVEQGKIDLDADVNRYIDFKIPAFDGRPITMRNLLTHTPGFEEVLKGGIRYTGDVPPLAAALKRWTPRRVFAPGTTPAYSNYGAALAGYIVERVSGEPFDSYIERHIFQPLDMTHSTFRQPLPEGLAPFMAQGYPLGSGPPKPYELILVPPAGSAAISGADIAKFMLAHLNDGAGILKPDTARAMHDPVYGSVPSLNRMALGFYEQRLNGLSAIAHGGDLNFFHTYLWLLPEQHLGLFVSMNSEGQGNNFGMRLTMFQQFGDRYFPSTASAPVELATAKEHAKLLVGSYISSRGSFSNFLYVANLFSQVKVGLDQDGRPLIPNEFGGPPVTWIETAPFVWQDARSGQRLGATIENGKAIRWSLDAVSPFMVWIRPSWYRDAAWLFPAFIASLVVVAIVALSWPIGVIVRRRYGVVLQAAGSDLRLYRLVRGLAWLVLAVLAGWAAVLMLLVTGAASESVDVMDWGIRLLQIAGAIGFLLLFVVTCWNLWRVRQRRRDWLVIGGSFLLTSAAGCLLWVAVAFKLLAFGTNY